MQNSFPVSLKLMEISCKKHSSMSKSRYSSNIPLFLDLGFCTIGISPRIFKWLCSWSPDVLYSFLSFYWDFLLWIYVHANLTIYLPTFRQLQQLERTSVHQVDHLVSSTNFVASFSCRCCETLTRFISFSLLLLLLIWGLWIFCVYNYTSTLLCKFYTKNE